MGRAILVYLVVFLAFWSYVSNVTAEDAYKYYTWTVILINGQFPGPTLDSVTNENIILNLRKNSWQDGVVGTNCAIPPNSNYTYKFQTKDQIGSYTYFPSTLMHKAAGGFGALNVYARSVIPVPYPKPDGDFSLLIGDWYTTSHNALQQILDSGNRLPFPDGILINGQGRSSFNGDQGKTYMFRVSNVGLSTSFNFRIQGHKLKLVEVEGSNVLQNMYDSLDVHVGQSVTLLVTLDQSPKDYYIVASTRFTKTVLTSTSVLHYTNSQAPISGPVPAGPTFEIGWSIDQARSYRTITLANSAPIINGKQRYAVNGVSYTNSDTPLKLADYFNIPGVFSLNSIQSAPSNSGPSLATSVMGASHHEFVEVVLQNNEDTMQSWHLDGYDFWVYPSSWTVILVSLDNQGMWNMRSAMWDRQYLGQQFYLRVYNPTPSFANEYDIPSNALLCAMVLNFLLGVLICLSVFSYVNAEDPYVYLNWVFEYGQISPLGVNQRGILVNGQFPGPTVNVVTNDNTSWQDGVLGTNCPIPPNSNWTYRMQMKDQIGTYTYFPSTLMHRAAGGFGGFNILARSVIAVPYPKPLEEFTVLVSDWWKKDHKELQNILDTGNTFPLPDGILINGNPRSTSFDVIPGQTYLFRVSNIGLSTSINFRIQGHTLRLVECEGSHTMQEVYESLDIHVGQSSSFLVTLHDIGDHKDYFIVASTRFTKPILTSTATLHYQGSRTAASGPLPIAPTYHIHWSMKQARTIRWNLTANAARPNPQGSFHYGTIPVARTIVLENTAEKINGKTKYAINKVSYVNPDTPLKLADYYNIPGVFTLNSIKDTPPAGPAVLGTGVIGTVLHDFVEIVFQNTESTIQSWHLDGYDFWSVGRYLGQELYVRVWNDERSLFTEYDIPENALLCGKAKR
ncbi:hypothetical protein ACJIZ3_014854 [Penstemon smallii]|uniref:Uncharacterized protein n=1 Tax=Penstemon smallii TaxID=265156 RepID=A0ABD3RP89_9LAMI